MISTRINNRYQIDSVLGHGGMSTVYKGFDTMLERDVALKILTGPQLVAEGRRRLLQEAKAVAQLSHPNIITVYDVGEFEKSPFIVMEYLEGVNLYQQPPEDVEEIIRIIREVCAALVHAHEHGIIHRDLKPENVILAGGGTVKLTDFGLARPISSRLTSEGIILGTVFYLAPEQAQGQPIDQRSDLYSLGVMLYELTTGELPFMAGDPLAVVTQHIHAPVVPPRAKNEHIPPALEALILQLLEKDPADRPETAQEVLERLSVPEVLDLTALPAEELSVLDRIVGGRLVGRGQELKQARQMWGQAMIGQGQLLLVSGEPGVGKTRLMREIITQAEISGGTVLIGRSYVEGDPPYSPFRHILSAALNISREAGLEIHDEVLCDLLTIAPELRPNFPGLPDIDPEDAENQQQRLFNQILYLFNLLTRNMPVLMVLEDVHWTDASSLKLLRHLVCNTRTQRMMILATYREVEPDEARALHETLLDFQREKVGTRLKLKRLTRQETRDMLAILFAEEIKPDFLEGIYRETDGNPFFIEEVCKAIVESGKLTFEEGRWKRPSMQEVGVPQSIQVAIQSRLKVLSENAQKTLEQAAVIGREFDFELLQCAMETDEDSLLDSLDDALYARLVEEIRGNGWHRFGFVHALVPTTITTGLRTLQRRRLHRRAAGALEDLQPEAFEALAYQFIEAGETDKGVDYLIKAGNRARGLFAHAEAISSYRQAVEHLAETGEVAKAAKTLMKLGLTYHSDFQFSEAHKVYDQAFNLWELAGRLEEGRSLPSAPHAFRFFTFEPPTLDPTIGGDDGRAIRLINNLFCGLVVLNSDMEIMPEVAQRWEILEGGLRYVFHLRKDVTWSDGAPVTAHDFEFAWKRVLSQSRFYLAEPLFIIKNAKTYYEGGSLDMDAVGVHARGEFTLEVELERPSQSFLHLLYRVVAFPVPSHLVVKFGSKWTDSDKFVTNGPFRLSVWEKGKSIFLEADPTYKGRFPGNVNQVEINFYSRPRDPKDQVDLRLYQENRIDTYQPSNQDDYKFASKTFPEDFRTAPWMGGIYMFFNTLIPPFDDSRVRKALALATDREYLINTIHRGVGFFPATGGLIPPGMHGHSEGIVLPYDPDQARHLLIEAGYPGGVGFPIIKISDEFNQTCREFLKNQWGEILGIEFDWVDIDSFDLFYKKEYRNLHLWSCWLVASKPDPEDFLGVDFSIHGIGWLNDKFQNLVNRSSEITDNEKRLDLYQQAERIILEEVPLFPISYNNFVIFLKPWVRRYSLSVFRRLKYLKEVILEQH